MPIPRDILDISAEQLGHPEPSIVSKALLDAAIRSICRLPAEHPRRVEFLNQEIDALYQVRVGGEGQGGLVGLSKL